MDGMMLTTLAGAASWIVSIGLQIGLLVVALTAVRRASPEASGMMATAAGIGLFGGCVGVVVPMVTARMADDTSGMLRANAITTLLGTLMHLGAFSLLIAGIARLAATRPGPREGA